MFLTVISDTGIRKRIPLTLLMQNQLSSIEGVCVYGIVLSMLIFEPQNNSFFIMKDHA